MSYLEPADLKEGVGCGENKAAYCLLPIAYCLLPIAYCLLPIAYCLLPIAYCLLPIAFCLSSPFSHLLNGHGSLIN
jgi:hypothetical protein